MFVDSVIAPAARGAAVAPHDVNPIGEVPKALFVGTGGNLTLCGVDGGPDVLLKNVQSGTIIPIRARYVRATGTTAADIVALY
ncbi:MAG TPA: hypothetical protein VGD19_06960 [Allosphingosinicella sp.]|jgi:hypothetical protein